MSKLKEQLVGGFNAPGREVEHKGQNIRPEVRVDIGIGKITEAKEGGNGTARIVMTVEGAKYPFHGYINTNEPVYEVLTQAKEKGMAVAVRFEKKRKANVDPTTGIDDLTVDMNTARDNIVRIVSGVFNTNTESWVLSGEAQSSPAEDPKFVMDKISQAAFNTTSFFATQKPKLQGAVDDKANCLITMYHFILEQEVKGEFTLSEPQRKKLATLMLSAVDLVQMGVYGQDEPSYRDYSHTKARSLLFKYAETTPFAKENASSSQAIRTWLETFVSSSVELWKWALAESDDREASDE